MRDLYNCHKIKSTARKKNTKKKIIKNYPNILNILN